MNATEAEKAVLGAILLDNTVLPLASDIVHPEDFYLPVHRDIFTAMQALDESGKPIDLATVTVSLLGNKYFEEAGSTVYLAGLMHDLPAACQVKVHANIVRNDAVRRKLNTYALDIAAKTQEAYRYAFRHAYLDQSSPEVLFSTRVTDNNHNSRYTWPSRQYMRTNERYAYNPTEEYIEMFPWADGKPFNWDETEKKGELDHIFIKGSFNKSKQELQNIVYTRDPRLYENTFPDFIFELKKVPGKQQIQSGTDHNEVHDGEHLIRIHSNSPFQSVTGSFLALRFPASVQIPHSSHRPQPPYCAAEARCGYLQSPAGRQRR